MVTSILNKQKALDILKEYKGNNPYIMSIKNGVYTVGNMTLSDFHAEYILCNHDKDAKYIGKIVKIMPWYGEKKQQDWNTDFVPEKLFVGYFLGETKDIYHFYCQYRKAQDKMVQVFAPKSAIITPLIVDNWKDKVIDFEKYNQKCGFALKPMQERGVKFLSTRKKAILSLQMGGGKTLCSIVAALEGDYKKILVICPASLKTNWRNEISRLEMDDDITIVEGSKWAERKWTVMNYDILKNFYTVPKEIRNFTSKEIVDGKIVYKTTQKEVKSNKKEVVYEALKDSQLYNAEFDLLIIDEAHRLSNKSSGMYQIVEDLIKRTHPDGIFELTGTAVRNNPMNLYNVLKLIGADVTKDWITYMKQYCGAKQVFANKKLRNYYQDLFLKSVHKATWFDLTQQEKDALDVYLSKNCKKIMIPGEPQNLEELAERIKHLYYKEDNEELLKTVKKEVIIKEYMLTPAERTTYDKAWDDFIEGHEGESVDSLIENHKLIEGSILRQTLADFMVPHTIELSEREIALGKKVLIFCCFDNELYTLQEHFGDRCVVYNGKMTAKKKDAELKKFKENEDVQVFIGNIQAASVGLNLNEASTIVFNNISFVPSDNEQAEYRILRIGQDKDCTIFYQKFTDTYMDRMFEILNVKNNTIQSIILDEKQK